MPAEGRENPLLKKGNSDAFFREKYLTKNNCPDPLQEPGREVTITVQAVLQVRHLLPQITLSQFHHLSSSWARSLGVIGGLAP